MAAGSEGGGVGQTGGERSTSLRVVAVAQEVDDVAVVDQALVQGTATRSPGPDGYGFPDGKRSKMYQHRSPSVDREGTAAKPGSCGVVTQRR